MFALSQQCSFATVTVAEEALFMITMDIPPPPTPQVVHAQTIMQQPSPEDAKKKREYSEPS